MNVVQTIANQVKPYLFCKYLFIKIDENTLRVTITGRTPRYITISYNASKDTYNVEEGYMKKDLTYKIVNKSEDLYIEGLISIIKAYA